MYVSPWLRWLKSTFTFRLRQKGKTAVRRPRRPRLEHLEDRLAPATVQFGLANESLLETAGTFTIPVTISAPSASPISVPFTLGGSAVAGMDYSGVSSSPVVIPAGQTAVNITGTLLDDGSPDAAKTLTFTLGAPSGGNTLGAATLNTLSITEPQTNTTTLAISNSSAVEPAPNGTVDMNFTVTRTGDLTSQITVGYTTVAGTAQPATDFTPQTGTTTFASGSATATISIPIFGDGVYNNPNLTFSVQLTGIVSVVGPPVTLADQTPFTTGSSPFSVTTADLNGDGKPDLIVTNMGDKTVSVLLNTTAPGATTPSFAPQQTFATGLGPVFVTVGDLNGDGKPDLIVANEVDASISVLMNTTAAGATTASFVPQQTFATTARPRFVAVGDVNGDGKPDLIVADGGTGAVPVLNFVVGDAGPGGVSVLLNTTTPGATTASFAPLQIFAAGIGPSAVALADVNRDGKPDVVVTNAGDNTVSVLLNNTNPGSSTASFAAQQSFATGSSPYSVAVADVNGDGKPDLIVANKGDNTVSVLLNTTLPGASTVSFAAEQTFPTGLAPVSVAVGDVNGDGKPDILVANLDSDSVSLLVNTTPPSASTASFASRETFDAGSSPYSVALADVNGDGKLDLIVANQGDDTASVLLNTTILGSTTALPTFLPSTAYTAINPRSVAVADLNDDGKPDLLVASYGDVVETLINATTPGAATAFPLLTEFATGLPSVSITTADVNGDGKPDLIIANGYGTNTVSVLLNTTTPGAATASFSAPETFTTGQGPVFVAVADVNGDGKPDLLVANGGDSTVSVLLNTTTPGAATASFAAQQTFRFPTGLVNPVSVAVRDLNGDGKPDLIVANLNGNLLSVLMNTTPTGASTASFTQEIVTTGNRVEYVAVADVNGDGKPDLIAVKGGDLTVLLNTTPPGAATASFGPQQTIAAGIYPASLAVGDVNGDGKPDILAADGMPGANTVSVLFNTTTPGASTASFAAAQSLATGNSPGSVALADVNGDGRLDLVVANSRDTNLSVFVNTPATIVGDTGTGTILESDQAPTPPGVTNPTVLNVMWTSATLGGNVSSDGGAAVTARGVLYAPTSTNNDPMLNGNGVTEVDDPTASTGVFTENVTGLTPGATYSFVAFATNSAGTAYTPVSTFTTPLDESVVLNTQTLSYTATEGETAAVQPAATFTDPGGPELTNGQPTPGAYSASIDWGDNTPATMGTITFDAQTQMFTVSGAHTYAEESNPDQPGSNPYQISVTITHGTAAPSTAVTATADVSDPSVRPYFRVTTIGEGSAVPPVSYTVGIEPSVFPGMPAGTTVAQFTDPGGAEPLSDYSADINWGNGFFNGAGTITYNSQTHVFTVTTNMAAIFLGGGTYSVVVRINHDLSTPTLITDAEFAPAATLESLNVVHTADPTDVVVVASNSLSGSPTYSATLQSEAAAVESALGLVVTDNEWTNFAGINGHWLQSTNGSNAAHGGWYFLLPNGTLQEWDGGGTSSGVFSSLIATFSPAVYNNPQELTTATTLDQAATVEQTLDLLFTGSFHNADYGINADWIKSDNGSNAANDGWYFLLPDGTLHQWNGVEGAGALSSPTVATLNGTYWYDPFQLLGAPQAATAATTEQSLDLLFTGSYYNSSFGVNADWLQSGNGSNSANGGWYFLLPDGTLHGWDGAQAFTTSGSSPVVATLAYAFWQDPSLLYNPTTPQTPPAGVSASFTNPSNNFLHLSGFKDSAQAFGVQVSVANGGNTTSQEVLIDVTDQAPTLAAVPTQTVTVPAGFPIIIASPNETSMNSETALAQPVGSSASEAVTVGTPIVFPSSPTPTQIVFISVGFSGTLSVTLAGSDADPNETLTYNAQVFTDSLSAEAVASGDYATIQSLGLTSFRTFSGFSGEWLRSTNASNSANGGWYFLMPDGTLHQWDGAAKATSPVVAAFDPAYYANIVKLLAPAIAPGVTVSVSGNVVTFGGFDAFAGQTLYAAASVSDGILQGYTSFAINVVGVLPEG